MKSLCVFCGSSPGGDPAFADAARALGRLLAGQRIQLVFGGGSTGLMGIIADVVLAAGGQVTGVIPRSLWDWEVGHRGLTETHIVSSMHERKALMADLAEGFVALPGGIGTLDEFFEIWTWAQLGIHQKPFGLLNINGYFDALLGFLDHSVRTGFFSPAHRGMLLCETRPESLISKLVGHRPAVAPKWSASARRREGR